MSVAVTQQAKATGTPPFTDTLTGAGFTPKLLFTLMAEKVGSANGNSTSAGFTFGFGLGSTTEGRNGWGARDNVATSETGQTQSNTKIGSLDSSTPGSRNSADFTGFNSDGATVSWTTSNDASLMNNLWLGGADITNVGAVDVAMITSTGNQTYAHGLGATPDIIFLFATNNTTSGQTLNHADFCIGAAKSATERWTAAVSGEDAETVGANLVAKKWQRADRCLLKMIDGSGTADAEFDFVSMDGTNITLNQIDAPANASRMTIISIKGGSWALGATNKSTGGAPVDQAIISGLSFTPKGAMFVTVGNPTSTSIQNDATMSIGFGVNSSAQNHISGSFKNATINTQADKRISGTKVLSILTAGTPTLLYEGSYKTNDSGGVTLTWNTNNANADEILWCAFGSSSTATVPILTSVNSRRRR